MSTVKWITPAGSLGIIVERTVINIPLEATSDSGNPVTFSLLAGDFPRGLKLIDGIITGSPVEVRIWTKSRFVIRADDGEDIEDRTFYIEVDGADEPQWITNAGFLNVGPGKAYFVLDNSKVDFQLEARDNDEPAGDELEYFLMPRGGELPPGLSLSRDGRITGFTDPIFAFDYSVEAKGGYDVNPFDITPLDFREIRNNGFDTYLYDNMTYDYSLPTMMPRRLSRIYTFVVSVSDGLHSTTEVFKIYVVTEEFLKADNTLVQVDTHVFTADSSSARVPIWITESDLGRARANNYITIFLDVYKPPSLPGTISYIIPDTNPGSYELLGTDQVVPGHFEISGIVPSFKYEPTGQWIPTTRYKIAEAVLYRDDVNPEITNQTWVCIKDFTDDDLVGGTFPSPTEGEYWTKQNIAYSTQMWTPSDSLLWEPITAETISMFPPGLEFDTVTGQLAGKCPYQSRVTKTYNFTVTAIYYPSIEYKEPYNFRDNWNSSVEYAVNDSVRYHGSIYVCVEENQNVVPTDVRFWISSISSTEKTFNIDIFGEIDSAIEWRTESDLGTIKPNIPSQLSVHAESLLYGGFVSYSLIDGDLPDGMEFLPNGIIQGKAVQSATDFNQGQTRFFDYNEFDTIFDSGSTIFGNGSTEFHTGDGTRSFDVMFDGGTTSFDRIYRFTIRAQDSIHFAQVDKTFWFSVIADSEYSYVNLSVKAFQPKEKRLMWNNFITDISIFPPSTLYRYGDPLFASQSDLRMLVYAGIEKTEYPKYVQAISRNHYRKRILLGDLASAVAKDPKTQEVVYEVVYVKVVDEYEKNGVSISDTIHLTNRIDSKELISYNNITVDTDIQLASEEDHQRIFPNSFKNMRARVKEIGERDRDYLPLWMRSIQPDTRVEPGFVKAVVLCYAKPGAAETIKSKIRASGFDFKDLDFEADRYLIDIMDGDVQDKYFAFPHTKEKKL